jgi:YfiH family protein
MAFKHNESIRYFTFDLLAEHDLTHAIFTRQGGVSPTPWNSLNVGGTVGDDPARVIQNRLRSFSALGRPLEGMFDVWQVHGREVICAENPRSPQASYHQADAILTDRPHVTLFMRFADCVPVLLYDPVRQVVGLVHAGWQGTVKEAAAHALEAMAARYGSSPADILAGIGPSIGPHHYEVGPEVVEQVRATFGADAEALLTPHPGGNGRTRMHFDLWSANRLILENAGVRYIEVAGICTACHLEDWYSHRAENGRTGRFGSLIAL